MEKYTFTVEIVSESHVDTTDVHARLHKAVLGIEGNNYHAVNFDDQTDLGTQGLKVWAKRRMGVSLANPKPEKKAKAVETETPVEA